MTLLCAYYGPKNFSNHEHQTAKQGAI
jgi:hypothetical protein